MLVYHKVMAKYLDWIIVAVLAVIVLLFYWGLKDSFYQQDEWMALGNVLSLGDQYFLSRNDGVLSILVTQGRILSGGITYFIYKNYPFDVLPFVVIALGLHLVNTVLVYYVSRKLFKDRIAGFLAALFFALNSVSAGATTWPAASLGVTIASTSIILAVLLFYERQQFLCFGLLYISLHFKEIGSYLFFALPILSFFIWREGLTRNFRNYWYFYLFGILYYVFWYLQLKSVTVEKDLFLTGSSNSFVFTALARSVMYPLTSFSLSFFPSSLMLGFAKNLTMLYYPFLAGNLDLVSQTVVLDMIALVLTFGIFFVVYLRAGAGVKRVNLNVLVIVILSLGSYLPYIAISKSYAYLESRYYYLGVVGSALVLAFLVTSFKKKSDVAYVSLLVFVLGLTFLHLTCLRGEINRLGYSAKVNKSILEQVDQILPRMGESGTVIYLEGDRNYYIGEGNPLPFQQGTGYTIALWYYGRNPKLKDVVKDRFLWDLGSQGYKESNGYVFGYYWNKEDLKADLGAGGFGVEDVICLYYDSVDNRLSRYECTWNE